MPSRSPPPPFPHFFPSCLLSFPSIHPPSLLALSPAVSILFAFTWVFFHPPHSCQIPFLSPSEQHHLCSPLLLLSLLDLFSSPFPHSLFLFPSLFAISTVTVTQATRGLLPWRQEEHSQWYLAPPHTRIHPKQPVWTGSQSGASAVNSLPWMTLPGDRTHSGVWPLDSIVLGFSDIIKPLPMLRCALKKGNYIFSAF